MRNSLIATSALLYALHADDLTSYHMLYAITDYYSAPEYCDERVCLFVCP